MNRYLSSVNVATNTGTSPKLSKKLRVSDSLLRNGKQTKKGNIPHPIKGEQNPQGKESHKRKHPPRQINSAFRV
jgi:hypothetical protein